jgi:hypothetical protein
MSRKLAENWPIQVDTEEYETAVREHFGNQCPYCHRLLTYDSSVVEHLDGMNRLRAGLHVPGNVLVACKPCNNEKRRDDSRKALTLANSGWECFLSHDGSHCTGPCRSCKYWEEIWPDPTERRLRLQEGLGKILLFRSRFSEFQQTMPSLMVEQAVLLAKLYVDCQSFAEREINTLVERFGSAARTTT